MQNEYAGQIIFVKCNKIISSVNTKNKTENIEKLSDNIRKNGLLQPINIRPVKYGLYEIISGQRRFTACKLAGLTSVPCVIMNIDSKISAAFNFIENSFRKEYGLFEQSDIIKTLIIEHKYTIDEISSMMSADISEVINRLKILHFSGENRIKAENAKLTFSQCVSLLKLEDTEYFDKTIDAVIENHLNDFQTEDFVNKLLREKRNTVVFKDIRIFTNTISHAVEKMKSAGIDAQSTKTETDEKIEISISIPKKNNYVIRSRNT
ncbi:MAG: ParB/RepB/Spo0J family partition protein [Clostridia bacterium]|nr:ParB/RepB/Spo0J family partition protein [Clostridia bacterium]